MAAESSSTEEIAWSRLFPWIRIFRGVGFSIDGRKLILAALGLVVLHLGWEGLDRLFPASSQLTPPVLTDGQSYLPTKGHEFVGSLWAIPFHLIEPARYVVGPFLAVFSTEVDGWAFLHAVCASVWTIVVWGFFGGAICRIGVLQAAQGRRISLFKSLKFAAAHCLTLTLSPLSPFLGVALVAIFGSLFGLLYRLPESIGPTFAGILLFMPLLGGLVIAIIVTALAVGWPLIHATVAVEAEDGFDALSRSYAYVHQRPGRYAAYALLAWLTGCFGLLFVQVFARVVLHLGQWSLSFTAPPDLLAGLFGTSPSQNSSTAVSLHSAWIYGLSLLVRGWVFAYFWTAAGIIYLLLRRDVDGTDLHLVAIEEPPTPEPAPADPVKPDNPSPELAPATAG